MTRNVLFGQYDGSLSASKNTIKLHLCSSVSPPAAPSSDDALYSIADVDVDLLPCEKASFSGHL